jgi:hypothetical protein
MSGFDGTGKIIDKDVKLEVIGDLHEQKGPK